MSDLFDFFKEQESKLHQLPSEQAWRKLESRLEQRRRKRKRILFLQLGIIAVCLLLLLLAAILVWLISKPA